MYRIIAAAGIKSLKKKPMVELSFSALTFTLASASSFCSSVCHILLFPGPFLTRGWADIYGWNSVWMAYIIS